MTYRSAMLTDEGPRVSAYVNQVENKWFEDGKECFSDASRSDEVWSLMRPHPSSLQQASEPGDNQPVPGWSGFNVILFPEMAYDSNIGYCPMIDGKSSEYSTIYTVLKHAQKLTSALVSSPLEVPSLPQDQPPDHPPTPPVLPLKKKHWNTIYVNTSDTTLYATSELHRHLSYF